MARLLAWLRFAATVVMIYCSIASTRMGCGGSTNPATRVVPRRDLWWIHRHLDKVDEAKRRGPGIHVVFLGDSITQDYDLAGPQPSINVKPIWDELFAPRGAINLGFNGDQTGQMLWRIRHGEVDGLAPQDVVLLAGANNLNFIGNDPRVQTAEQIAAGIMAVVAELHDRLPAAHILVLSILPADLSAERATKRVQINQLLQQRVTPLPYARYLDVSGPFLDGHRVRTELYCDTTLFGSGAKALHPNSEGQRLMANLVANALSSH